MSSSSDPNAVPYIRVSISFFSSPCQYAPAREEFEEFTASRMRNVRAAAKVYEVALPVCRKHLALKAFYHFHLEVFAKLSEKLFCLLFCVLLPYKRIFS